MLTSIRIQNFRSIRDAQVKLGQVNLFIGPNNSGKSNFLKGIELASRVVRSLPRGYSMDSEAFENILFRKNEVNKKTIYFDVKIPDSSNNIIEYNLKFDNNNTINADITELSVEESNEELFSSFSNALTKRTYLLVKEFPSTIIYKIEPSSFELSTALSDQSRLSSNGQNISNFIYTLSQNNELAFTNLKSDFSRCLGNLTTISVPPDPDIKGNLKLKFFDSSHTSFWAEEVSEGVLYFLALLCIVHQPNPPKLLLLEEPEKGIHPRRIREVMDFIFELARLRDIQIILTSHSPYVVDHFADIPECISVFDRENGETVIRNAADIIAETNAKLKEPIRYSDALGEHWVSGFLGGVPL